jgi:hypothetical protein
MDKDEFKAMFDFGVSGEKTVGSWLGMKGATYFALYKLELLASGPRVNIGDGTTVACPDFICWNLPPLFSDQCFIEVKRFRKWWIDVSGEQTGIEEDKVNQYRTLAKKTGKSVFVCFLHLNDWHRGEGIFCCDIGLEHSGTTSPNGQKLLMFDRSKLTHLASEEDLAYCMPTDGE